MTHIRYDRDQRIISKLYITRWVSRLVLVLVWYWDNQISRDSWPFLWSSTYVSATIINLCYVSRYSSAKTDQNHVIDALHYGLSSTSIKRKRSCINKSQICPSLQIKCSNIPMCCFELNYTKLCLQFHLFPRNYYWIARPVCARLRLQMCKAPTKYVRVIYQQKVATAERTDQRWLL